MGSRPPSQRFSVPCVQPLPLQASPQSWAQPFAGSPWGWIRAAPAPPAKCAAASPPCPSTLLGLSWSDFLSLMRAPEYPFSLGTPPRPHQCNIRSQSLEENSCGSGRSSLAVVTPALQVLKAGRKNQATPGHLRPEKVPRVWGRPSPPSPPGRCLEQ